jgi:hypothetical protein
MMNGFCGFLAIQSYLASARRVDRRLQNRTCLKNSGSTNAMRTPAKPLRGSCARPPKITELVVAVVVLMECGRRDG